jgi:hypothetical protein
MRLLLNYKKVDILDATYKGIQVIECASRVEIYTDTFRTVPLFVTRDKENELIVFSDFEKYYSFELVKREVDKTGFWEIVLFGSALWTRTLYKNVEQIPSASCLSIDKASEQYKIERYWNYFIKEDEAITSLEQAADGLHSILDRIFSRLNPAKHYILGMSGGLDSRLTLAYLSSHISRDNIQLFTYGFDNSILEYKYATDVAEALGVARPVFHQLSPRSYRESLEYLPQMSGGQVAINHCHIIDYLKTKEIKNDVHISTYLSDALFGYECVSPQQINDINNNYYARVARSATELNAEIRDEIISDSMRIFSGFEINSNFSSLDEFKYITERNIKFHVFLAHLQNKHAETLCIYADIELLKYCLTVPIRFRENKNIIDALLNKYFPEISMGNIDNISSRDSKASTSRFQWDSRFWGFCNWHIFRLLNRINSILRIISMGRFQLTNIYQTEEHERLLYRDFKESLHLATTKLVSLGILTKNQKEEYDTLPIRSAGISERYAIISLAEIL